MMQFLQFLRTLPDWIYDGYPRDQPDARRVCVVLLEILALVVGYGIGNLDLVRFF